MPLPTRWLRAFPKHLPAAPAQIAPPQAWGNGGGAVVADTGTGAFYGWRVVWGAFVLAGFGWGLAFYGPPVFLSVIGETRGWPLMAVSSAGTLHFLIGAGGAAKLPRLYRR